MRIACAILALALLAGLAKAQTCSFGLYVDSAGSESSHVPIPNEPFNIYAVLHVEALVAAVGYTVTFPEFLEISATSYGPTGAGINVPSTGGDQVGLGECAVGFGIPVLVTTYSAMPTAGGFGVATIGPNLDHDPVYPVYASCTDQIIPCQTTTELRFEVLDVESASIGAVKALYGD